MLLKTFDEPIGKARFFKWREALWVPRWKLFAVPKDEQIIKNIETCAFAMDRIRTMFGKEIIVTSWYRPEPYNQLIGGAKKSAHIDGLACDFLIKDMESNTVREILRRYLKDLNIRMEKLDTVHVHIDTRCDKDLSLDARYFKP